MTLSMSARPAPGTTELLEVLDRVLDGGLVIDAGPRLNVVGFASSGVVARLVVAGEDSPRLQESEAKPGVTVPGAMLLDEPPTVIVPKRRHG